MCLSGRTSTKKKIKSSYACNKAFMLWKRVCLVVTTEIFPLVENSIYLLAGLICQYIQCLAARRVHYRHHLRRTLQDLVLFALPAFTNAVSWSVRSVHRILVSPECPIDLTLASSRESSEDLDSFSVNLQEHSTNVLTVSRLQDRQMSPSWIGTKARHCSLTPAHSRLRPEDLFSMVENFQMSMTVYMVPMLLRSCLLGLRSNTNHSSIKERSLSSISSFWERSLSSISSLWERSINSISSLWERSLPLPSSSMERPLSSSPMCSVTEKPCEIVSLAGLETLSSKNSTKLEFKDCSDSTTTAMLSHSDATRTDLNEILQDLQELKKRFKFICFICYFLASWIACIRRVSKTHLYHCTLEP